MAKTVDFIFDFGSPNAYLAFRALPPVLERARASVKIVPCLLGGIFKLTNNRAPLVAFAEVKGKNDYDMLEMRRFVTRHGLSRFRLNPHFPVNTLRLMRGLLAAEELGVGDAYLEAGLCGMWEEGLKLDDAGVLAGRLRQSGLDAEAVLALAEEQRVKDALAANTQAAVDRGVFGIPTFFVGDEMFFGKERLSQIEELLLSSGD
ncbi:MAG: 2-hydroxychromene-2-carboxylate isomerase [Parvularculaceae bacterium]|jgi:2-hydroxychromene-2-carboxylate isomerase|nr:2-hydroxychromene-2-carboxylate isomerase [Parvularculaceae bacterium]